MSAARRVSGLIPALVKASQALQGFRDALLGVQVQESRFVAPGKMYRVNGVLVAHPLDVIALQYPRDPHGRLDAAADWIAKDAARKADEWEPCEHYSWTGDEGPVADLGRWPVRWRCDGCGVVRRESEDMPTPAVRDIWGRPHGWGANPVVWPPETKGSKS